MVAVGKPGEASGNRARESEDGECGHRRRAAPLCVGSHLKGAMHRERVHAPTFFFDFAAAENIRASRIPHFAFRLLPRVESSASNHCSHSGSARLGLHCKSSLPNTACFHLRGSRCCHQRCPSANAAHAALALHTPQRHCSALHCLHLAHSEPLRVDCMMNGQATARIEVRGCGGPGTSSISQSRRCESGAKQRVSLAPTIMHDSTRLGHADTIAPPPCLLIPA